MTLGDSDPGQEIRMCLVLYRKRKKRQLLSPNSLCTLDIREIAEACR